MALAVEPDAHRGRPETRELDDGWTVVTADGGRAVHWEHTVAVTEDGPRILTLPAADHPLDRSGRRRDPTLITRRAGCRPLG
jgi:hypothetical protein